MANLTDNQKDRLNGMCPGAKNATLGTALKQAQDDIDALEAGTVVPATLESTDNGEGASLIGVEAGSLTTLTGANVQATLESADLFLTNLGLTTEGEGAVMVGVEAGSLTTLTGANVQATLESADTQITNLLAQTYEGFYITTAVQPNQVTTLNALTLVSNVPLGKQVMVEGFCIECGATGWSANTGGFTNLIIQDEAGVNAITIPKAALTNNAVIHPWTATIVTAAVAKQGLTVNEKLEVMADGTVDGGATPTITLSVWGRFVS